MHAMSVRAIDAATVRKICSGQVIVDVCSAVKELVENALDAGATVVNVKLQDSGLKLIEVGDNGSGIAKENHASVALPHWTSKLSSFEDLQSVCTFSQGYNCYCFLSFSFCVFMSYDSYHHSDSEEKLLHLFVMYVDQWSLPLQLRLSRDHRLLKLITHGCSNLEEMVILPLLSQCKGHEELQSHSLSYSQISPFEDVNLRKTRNVNCPRQSHFFKLIPSVLMV